MTLVRIFIRVRDKMKNKFMKLTILISLLLYLSWMALKEYMTNEIYPIEHIYSTMEKNSITEKNPTTEKNFTKSYGDYAREFCQSVKESIDVPSEWKNYCPQKGIVTVHQVGRLGNQMWEYASAWVIAKKSGHEPYVPICMLMKLEEVFDGLTIPPLNYIAHCPVYKRLVSPPSDKLVSENEDILLPAYAQLPEHVVPFLPEVLNLFTFKPMYVEKSQQILHSISRNVTQAVFVAVHVRRDDYLHGLPAVWNVQVIGPQFFLNGMEYYQNKHKNSTVLFVVVSDDTDWCLKNLQRGREEYVFVESSSDPGQDLALMAACNHSLIDYGTFGTWGAAMAGGETYLYNLTWGLEFIMSQMIPNWHVENYNKSL